MVPVPPLVLILVFGALTSLAGAPCSGIISGDSEVVQNHKYESPRNHVA
jgi:hypothetical protein